MKIEDVVARDLSVWIETFENYKKQLGKNKGSEKAATVVDEILVVMAEKRDGLLDKPKVGRPKKNNT